MTEWLVIGLVILALIAGWVLKGSIQGQTAAFASETLSVRYPVDWLLGKDEEALFTVRDPDSPSTFNTVFSARVEPLGEMEEQEYVFKVEGVDASVKPLGQVTGLNAAANRLVKPLSSPLEHRRRAAQGSSGQRTPVRQQADEEPPLVDVVLHYTQAAPEV